MGNKETLEEVKPKDIQRIISSTDAQTASIEIVTLFTKLQQERRYSEGVICKHCEKVISVEHINNHLFMAVKSGGLIHWSCKL